MRELLIKWAELEPARCEPSKSPRLANIFTIQAGEDAKNIYTPDNPTCFELAWIQWAVQAAIVSQGWSFELKYNPDSPDPRNPYDATVDSTTGGGWGFGNENFVAPLLDAYLHTLEGK